MILTTLYVVPAIFAMRCSKAATKAKTGRKMAKIIFPVRDCESQNDLRNALSSFIVEELFNYFSCILHSIFAFQICRTSDSVKNQLYKRRKRFLGYIHTQRWLGDNAA